MMHNDEKIGLGIITFNSENYFKKLFESLPDHKYDELVVVNGGNPYDTTYKRTYGNMHWIQHETNLGSARSRNDALNYLYNKGCDHIFIFEDDLIVKNDDIFDEYIRVSKITGLQYLHFVSYAWNTGHPGNRTPKLDVHYDPNTTVSFHGEMCNEASYRTRKLHELVGLYDEKMVNGFDVEWVKRATDTKFVAPFRYFADLSNSDDLIMNNPDATSRLDADGKRLERLKPDYLYFMQKHGIPISHIPDIGIENTVDKLKSIRNTK